MFEVAGGRYAVQTAHSRTVHETANGSVVRTIPATRDDYGFFSPDGRYLRMWDQMSGKEPFTLIELDSGQQTRFPAAPLLGGPMGTERAAHRDR